MSPKEVTATLGGDVHAVRFAFKRLERAGIARAEGATISRKWMLAKQARPAKEEP
jgi:hypothetical protein